MDEGQSTRVGSNNLPERVGSLTEVLQDESQDKRRITEIDQEGDGEPRKPGFDVSPDSSPEDLDKLGSFHFDQYRRLGEVKDLEKSLKERSRALALTPNDHPEFINRLANLAMSYGDRYERLGELEDLENSVGYRSRVLELTPNGHSDMSRQLADLAESYSDRYKRLGGLGDLNKALEYRSRALALTPDGYPDMAVRLADIAMTYTDRYRRLGDPEDLDKSLECRSRALALTLEGDPDMPDRLAGIAVSYGDRYERLGKLEDLTKALESRSRALKLTPDGHPDMPNRLSDLAVSYSDRYRRLGEVEDLEKMLEFDSRALALTPDGHPDIPDRLANLAASCTDRYRRLGKLEDLEKSVEYDSRALALTPNDHPDIPDRLASLGVSYNDKYRRLGELEDLDRSIEYRSRALALTPNDHPDIPDRYGHLAVSYSDRYEHLGELEDLEKSLECDTQALNLTLEGHPDMPLRFANLAASYTHRYGRLDKLEDLNKSLEYRSRALELTPDDHPELADRLASLALSHRDRYRRLNQPEDLDKSLECNTRALELTPNGHPYMPDRLANLAVSYGERYRRMGTLEDLEKSLEYRARALALTPSDNPDLSSRHHEFAVSLVDKFDHTGDPSHAIKSLESFRSASQLLTAPPRDRFQNALQWAKLACKHNSLNPMEAFQTTLDLLPQFIRLGPTTTQRYHDLSTVENLAVNAASVAIVSSQHMLALEWLEHARCVVWNQSLMLRSPLDRLHSFHPGLATKLRTVADQLHDAGSQTRTQAAAAPPSDSLAAEMIGQGRRRLAGEYHKLLFEVRQLPGFKDFLQPMKAKSLIHAARNGPIAVINCHEDRCDALLVIPGHDDVSLLHLPEFTEKKAQSARFNMAAALRQTGLRERGVKKFQEPGPRDRIENVLVTLWSDVVKPILEFLGYMHDVPGDNLPHMTWCPTGALSFLPLHAAGDYKQPGSRVFDYVISSYTPTLTALLASTPSALNGDCRILAVGQANTPHRSPLPGTTEELSRLRTHIHDGTGYSQLIDDQATTQGVLDAMEQHDWVHMACHAHQNIEDPTKSGFFLHDGTLDLASINSRSFENKGLAFLSACQTATGDEKLPDEAIHLASGVLMAGYRSVIATMWSVSDSDAPLVADKVYEQLMKDGKVGNGEAGKALHHAVAVLREKVGEKQFGRWVPYIHIGS